MKGKKEVGAVQIGIYGLGNFAAQLSWTMVSTYLVIFIRMCLVWQPHRLQC